MMCCFRDAGFCPVESTAWCYVRLDAYDGFYVRCKSFGIEFYCAEEIAVVGDGDGIHVKLFTALKKFVEVNGAIEQ